MHPSGAPVGLKDPLLLLCVAQVEAMSAEEFASADMEKLVGDFSR